MSAWGGGWWLLLVGCFVFGGVARGELPVWEAGEREAMEEAGWLAGDLIEELLIDEEGPFPGLETPLSNDLQEPVGPVAEVSRELLDAYFAERPVERLIDPQRLLESDEFRKRKEFLDAQVEDSALDLSIYLFGGDEDIPGEARVEELAERLFSEGKPAVVVLYHYGAPERTQMYLSPSLTDQVAAAEQRRALQDAAMIAAREPTAAEQLEVFCAQLSIRTYWIERMAVAGDEVASVPAATAPQAERKEKAGFVVTDDMRRWAVLGGLLLVMVGLLWVLVIFRRRRGGMVFPDFGAEPRLGGEHAAGVGAVISFASASLPPSLQKDQPPDYLRRTRGRGISLP